MGRKQKQNKPLHSEWQHIDGFKIMKKCIGCNTKVEVKSKGKELCICEDCKNGKKK